METFQISLPYFFIAMAQVVVIVLYVEKRFNTLETEVKIIKTRQQNDK